MHTCAHCVRATQNVTDPWGQRPGGCCGEVGASLEQQALSSWSAALSSSATCTEAAETLETVSVTFLLAACLSCGFFSSIFFLQLQEKGEFGPRIQHHTELFPVCARVCAPCIYKAERRKREREPGQKGG